jgi:hypothetical protein
MTVRPNVMISYRTPDRSTADELFALLKSAGLSPWMDYTGIEPGSRWRDELMKELVVCDAFVALLTREYVHSEHCRMEIFIARSRGCPVLPLALEDCFDLLDKYEETKGLADIFMVRLYRLSVVGLPITRDDAFQRVINAATTLGQPPSPKSVYVAYCNDEAAVATRIARQLEKEGISTWIATRDCRVGDNWRQAQARGVMGASIQVVVMDDTIVNSDVLRTEIMLAEAVGLPLFTVLGEKLQDDPRAVAEIMKELRASDITFRRLTDVQPFRNDHESVLALARRVRSNVATRQVLS